MLVVSVLMRVVSACASNDTELEKLKRRLQFAMLTMVLTDH
jgi:hypothetical protein